MSKPLKNLDSRLDIEIYIMGEMKLEFLNFLSECFKDSFTETLSWGNFRRFQLILTNNSNWINIYFIILKNEENLDILLHTFKLYEKKNYTLMIYNANEIKSEKNICNLYDSYIQERDKLYDGILDNDTISSNLNKIVKKDRNSSNNSEIGSKTEELKSNLSYLNKDSDNLVIKLGFFPNMINKKTKLIKRHDNNSAYSLEESIFVLRDEELMQMDFSGLLNYLLSRHFEKFRVKNYDQFVDTVVNLEDSKCNQAKSSYSSEPRKFSNFVMKSIDWLIIFYIILCFYKFMIDFDK